MMSAFGKDTNFGFGNCVNYGTEFGLGLPIEVDLNRPLVFCHPAAGRYYNSSLSLFEDTNHPFMQILVDYGDYYPSTYPFAVDAANFSKFHRLPDSSDGAAVFRKASLGNPHWQMHVIGEAFEYLINSPPVDILYIDWFSWLDRFIESPDSSFCDMISHYVHKIRDGGLIIIDNKHENIKQWFNFPKQRTKVTEDSEIEFQCTIEWLGSDFNDEIKTFSANVVKVFHNSEGKLGDKNWFEEIKQWFWKSIPEMALTSSQIKTMIDNKQKESIHHLAVTWDDWHQTWRDVYIDLEQPYLEPIPPIKAWPRDSYLDYLRWLKNNPDLLLQEIKKRTYLMKHNNFKLTLIHGDIIQLAPSLYSNEAAIAVRNNLQQRIISRCSWWKGQTTVLQSGKFWDYTQIKGVIWSGENSTPNLTELLIQQSIKQPYMDLFPKMKPFKCRKIITISHGNASLRQLMESCQEMFENEENSDFLFGEPIELIVIYKDLDDYQEFEVGIGWEKLDKI